MGFPHGTQRVTVLGSLEGTQKELSMSKVFSALAVSAAGCITAATSTTMEVER
jgi:hypothetical protein